MKVAITGTGFMGGSHIEALKRVRGVQPHGIHGSSPKKSRQAADRWELPKAYDTFEDLLADGKVGSVHITTPNRLHFEQVMAALEAGKHVLCEKPLSLTSVESATLVDKAASLNLAVAVNYNVRFYPLNQEVRTRVAGGDLGEIHSVFGHYQQDWLLYETDYNWRVLTEEQGALRALADIGTHWIDLVQHVTGLEVEAVLADLKTVHPTRKRPLGEVETFSGKTTEVEATESIPIGTEDFGSLLLRFSNGARGAVFVSQVTAGYKNSLRYEIAGSQSALRWDSEDPNRLWQGHRNEPNDLIHKDPGLAGPPARGFMDYPGGHAEGYPDTFKMAFRAFYDSIADGSFKDTPPYATFADGHREILVCDAIGTSHREERWVTVGS